MNTQDAYAALMRGLVGLLEEWAEWQGAYRSKLGYPSRSAGLHGTGANSFEDMCDESDSNVNNAIDASVDDLIPAQRAAIMRRYGIAAVFRFQRNNYEQCLQDAHDRLLVVLPKKNVVIPMR